MRASECAGYPSQLAAVRAMALKGMGKAEIRQRTGLDSHRVGSLLAKVRAEARGGGPEWTPALEDKARRIYRAGIGVMAEAFGVTMAEFLLHATGVPAAEAGAEAEGARDGDVDAAGGDAGGAAGDPASDRSADADGDGADRPDAAGAEADGAGAAEAVAIEGDAAGAAEGRAGGDAAAGPGEAPAAAVAAEDSAVVPEAVSAPVAARGLSTPVPLSRAAGEELEEPVPAAPLIADTEIDGEVHLRSWDGQRLHVNGRVLTRIPRFYWRGSRPAAEAMRRKAPPAWGALSMEAAR